MAARKDPAGLTGKVLINGHPQPSNFRLMSGYVVQDDVVMGRSEEHTSELQSHSDLVCRLLLEKKKKKELKYASQKITDTNINK